ncbi:hypothetical protein A4S05_24355 [Nostoc sp. KVJ20]|uniref:hypothetical protein n=1 Tax=Nostoc sp. KVJ20 TaxID=457944 RepID=UPI00083D9418|nr:hypothetical protein [Nostoc sp. KVJ20]ODH02405.1 hypothetical protein A4S05_24355 [Nostoc sp. KVJ20]
MLEPIHELQQLAVFYRKKSENNVQEASDSRNKAEELFDSARNNPQDKDIEKLAQSFLSNAEKYEKIAAEQLELASICENPVAQYQDTIRSLENLIHKIRGCQKARCSNDVCREILTLIETFCLEESEQYENYKQCCGDIN